MKSIRAALLLMIAVIATVVLHTAALQSTGSYPRVLWLLVIGMTYHMVQPTRAAQFVILSAAILEMQSALPYGIEMTATLLSYVVMKGSSDYLLKGDALHTAVIHMAVWTLLHGVFLAIGVVAAQWIGLIDLGGYSFWQHTVSILWQVMWHSLFIACAFLLWQLFRRTFMRREASDIAYA